MDAIQTGLIGGLIGGSVAALSALRMMAWPKKVVAAHDAGDREGARRMIERHAPAHKARTIPVSKLLAQRQRVLGLWFVGDLDAVRAELAAHDGSAAYQLNVVMYGELALATEPDAPAAHVAAVLAAAQRVHAESNKLQRLLRDYADLIAKVVPGLAGQPVDPAAAGALITKTQREPAFTQIVVLRALVVAAERTGTPSLQLQARLAKLTRRWAG